MYRTLGLDSTPAGEDEEQTTQKLNEGVVDVLLNTRCYILPATMATTAGAGDYTMDPAILHIENATIEGSVVPFELVRDRELMDMRISGAVGTSPARFYAVQGSDIFMIYPTPSTIETINVFYVPFPTAMSLPEHDPSTSVYGGVPTEFHRAIVLYALSHMADQDDDQTSGQGVRYQQDYERWLVRIRKHVSQKGGTSLSGFKLKRRRQFAFHDRSTDGGW